MDETFNQQDEVIKTLNETVATLAGESEEHRIETETKLEDLQTSFLSVIVSLSEEMKEHINQTITDLQSDSIDPINVTLISVTTDLSCVKTDLSRVSDAVSDLSGDLEEHSSQTLLEIQSSLQKLTQLSVKTNTLQSILDSVDTKVSEGFASLDCATSSELTSHDTKLDSLSTQIIGDCNNVTTKFNFSDDMSNITEEHDNETVCLHHNQNRSCYTCGGTGGWRRAVYLDMTDLNTNCPPGWSETDYPKRTCGRASATDVYNICDSAYFRVSGGEYSQVCGKIRAYQWGWTPAFYGNRAGHSSIDEDYFTGVAVMHGSPRQHIWTFAAGAVENGTGVSTINQNILCPCDTSVNITIPQFVGSDYFCESGYARPDSSTILVLHTDDPLWDGDGCTSTSTCCSLNNPPYFTKILPGPTTYDLELRLCCYYSSVYEDIAVELIELYVK